MQRVNEPGFKRVVRTAPFTAFTCGGLSRSGSKSFLLRVEGSEPAMIVLPSGVPGVEGRVSTKTLLCRLFLRSEGEKALKGILTEGWAFILAGSA